MKVRNKAWIMIILLVMVFAVIGSFNKDPEHKPGDTSPVLQETDPQDDGTADEAQEEIDEQSLEESIPIEESRPRVLAFWVSWDEESKEQLDILENANKLLGQDIGFVGIHATFFDTVDKEEVMAYIKEKGYSFEIIMDEEGKKAEDYYVGSFPTTIFLNEKGEVVGAYTALIQEDKILQELEEILQNLTN
ncbi:TlpA disulfide reductase family protein [Natronincola ferrireducens]|uniref:AhpC/TSA family protein n=1 Tax=Natronincola ferrireducens TaxID=393762 RepID=A0A1G8WTE3_9FIRM|nr:TlpA disulfide reductase family protein [Natronincola ferrireducens]SDJ81682.1 AhpC/TSA family protein [Natronincola ferrireducens]